MGNLRTSGEGLVHHTRSMHFLCYFCLDTSQGDLFEESNQKIKSNPHSRPIGAPAYSLFQVVKKPQCQSRISPAVQTADCSEKPNNRRKSKKTTKK